MINQQGSKMPRQRLSYKRKSKVWRKECVDSIDKQYTLTGTDTSVRASFQEKYLNQRLYEGKTDAVDMAKYVNPYKIKGLDVPSDIAHFNIIYPKINVLVGEEEKRQFDYTTIVTTPNAISSKVEDKKKAIDEKLTQTIQEKFAPQMQQIEQAKQQGQDTTQLEEQLQQAMGVEMEKITKYSKYTWKDMREMTANRLLRHYESEQNFKGTFNDGFKDALVLGEEIYQCDIIDNEAFMSKLNPKNVYTVRSGRSSRIEDSDIIIIEDFWSPGRIIDTYYAKLKGAEIDEITGDANAGGGSRSMGDQDREFTRPHYIGSAGKSDEMTNVDDLVSIAEIDGYSNEGTIYDMDGNVRVLRVYWRSQKKVVKVKYYDEEGTAQYKVMAEEYILDTDRGEEGTTLWINEWWEGVKIAKDIYIDMQPRRIQYNKIENPSKGGPGIVGELYNTNQGPVVSMVSRVKSYQYLYDSIWDRLLKAIAKNMGKILEVDVAKIPANWDVGQWFHYATTMGVGFVDSFKEGNKGAATGKLAGGFNTTGKVLDVETGNYIQAQIQMLEYIKQEMAELVGVSKQREGQVGNRETVGGVERSVMQSSHVTEWWFSKHENTKIRALQMFIDTAKVAMRGSKKKLQYILDDMSIEYFIVDGDDFAESDYGVMIASNTYTREFKQRLDMFAQAGLQNQMLKFSDLLYLYSSNSLSDTRRKIEATEEEKAQSDAAASKAQQAEMQQSKELAMKEAELGLAKMEQDLEIDAAGLENERFKIQSDIKLRLADLQLRRDELQKQATTTEKSLEEDIRSNKAGEGLESQKIAAMKAKPSTNK